MIKHPLFVLALLMSITACSAMDPKLEREMTADLQARQAEVATNINQSMAKSSGRPFVGSKVIKRKSEDEVLPDGFSLPVTIGDGVPLSLTKIGQRITAITRIPVNISPDLLPSSGTTAGTAASGNSLPLIAIAFSGTLSELLDRVSSRMGIAWEYRDGAINFSRYVTRIYTLDMYPGKSTQNASVGKSGASATGISGGASSGSGTGSSGGSFSSSSTSDFSSELDPWGTVENAMKALKSPGGQYSISPTSGMIVMTDTKDAHERANRYIRKLEKIMKRQIALKVAVISADAGNRNQAGIDWNLVWNRLSAIAPNYALSFRGVPNPASLTQNGGGLGLNILTPTGGQAGKWDGSTAVYKALNSVTNATMMTDNVWYTLNKQPVSVALADQTGFVSTSMEQNTTGGNPVATQSISMITTGFILNMVPSTTDGDEILLQFSLDISTPPTITAFGAVQAPAFSSKQIGQRAKLREGETLILSGFSLRDKSFNKSGMFSPDDSLLAGGNRSTNMRSQDLVILITPIVE